MDWHHVYLEQELQIAQIFTLISFTPSLSELNQLINKKYRSRFLCSFCFSFEYNT